MVPEVLDMSQSLEIRHVPNWTKHLAIIPNTFHYQVTWPEILPSAATPPPSLIIDHLNSSICALRCLQNWSPKQCPLPVSTLPLHDLFAMLKQSDVFLKCKSYYSPAWNSFIHLTCLLQISYNTLCSFAATDFLPTSPDNTVRPLHSSNNNSIVISPATPYSSFSLGIFTRCSFKTLSTVSQDCP